MKLSVTPGLNAKEIAILHYQLLMEDKWDDWILTITKIKRKNPKKRGSSPFYWWNAGRKLVEKGMSYKFKNKDERFSTDKRQKFFFYRLDKEGKESGMPVPITVMIDLDDNNEWRVDVSSW